MAAQTPGSSQDTRKSQPQTVIVGKHRIRLTNLEKVLYPETGTTKADVLDYYARVATVLIPHSRNRPATRKRWVHGVGTAEDPGEMFFQKNLDDSTPEWVTRATLQHSDHKNDYPLVNNTATLTWFGQIAALEIHVPQWKFGRDGNARNPDRLVLDLDPGPGAGLLECAEVARFARSILADMGLDAMPVTSGSKGIHLYAALDGTHTSGDVSSVAHELARALEADHPDLIVSDMKKSLREGKVLVDWSQNNGNKTTIAPYSLRGRAHPMVAAPRTWRELSSKSLAQLDYREVLKRVATKGDVLSPLLGDGGSLEAPDPASADRDRLHTYRSMRDGSKTPEPVPAAAPDAGDGNSFVIQEHHARRLHWDFRLEHDGVLVSWALPKGVPEESGKNHLAVQTEDHPLEYGSFAGEIPKGEYGAGTVSIWDSGTYELEKWREGKEVIATLHGEQHGTRKYALIHTGGHRSGSAENKSDDTSNQWLIHLMKDQPADDANEPAKKAAAKKAALKKAAPKKAAPLKAARKTVAERPPLPPKPMLATLGVERDIDRDDDADADPYAHWAFEMKWDGIRAIVTIDGDDVRLTSRNGLDLTATYPELQSVAGTVDTTGGRAVLDGEIVAFDKRGRPDFGLLQSRFALTKPDDVERARKAAAAHLLLFDVLEVDGKPVMKLDYDDRRDLLERIVHPTGAIQVPPAFDGDLEQAVASSRQLGLEGVMAKRRDASYSPGRRTNAWIKLKQHFAQEVIIAGWRPGNGARANRIGSLLLAVPDGTALRYVGRVGTGFTDAQLDEIAAKLRRKSRKTNPLEDVPAADARDANWVTPDLVGEVEFAEWTSTGRLRQPSWRGWRPDKSAADVVREG